MIIRPATKDDLPAIMAIRERCALAVDGVNYTDWSGWLLVAERQSQVIGLVHVIPSKPYAIVAEFGVLPEFQKGRAGHKLIEAAELMMRVSGYTEWVAFVGNDRNGFHETIQSWGAILSGEGKSYWRKL